jgi:hypothetical protein
MITNESKKLAALAILLRVYGVLTLVIFGSLLVGFAIQTPLLADEPKGALNWVIWNGIRCGSEPCYVPPMLFIIHIVWGVFFFMAARSPSAYVSFLSFTMWAYLAHGLLMAGQALTHMSTQWHRFLMDIPYELILALGIYLWREGSQRKRHPCATRESASTALVVWPRLHHHGAGGRPGRTQSTVQLSWAGEQRCSLSGRLGRIIKLLEIIANK